MWKFILLDIAIIDKDLLSILQFLSTSQEDSQDKAKPGVLYASEGTLTIEIKTTKELLFYIIE